MNKKENSEKIKNKRGDKMRYPHRSKRTMSYHGRTGKPIIHRARTGRTYTMVRAKGGGTKRLYGYKKYMK